MGGSISPRTVERVLRETGNPIGLDQISDRMVCRSSNIGFKAFLDKFTILDETPWPAWAIELAVEQICEDLAAEKIHYTEISLSIDKYVRMNNWDPKDALISISQAFERSSSRHAVQVGLLLSLRYDSPRDRQLLYGALVKDEALRHRLCGLDLIGDEDHFDAEFYRPIFDLWRFNGKTLRAHVGEMPGKGGNVKKAIEILGVNRIAHGIQADKDTLKLAADRRVCFDLALHSNLVTGAWLDINTHPIRRMIDAGCVVTINTDDPVQFGCTLNDEFNLAIRHGLISENESETLMRNAWEATRHQRVDYRAVKSKYIGV